MRLMVVLVLLGLAACANQGPSPLEEAKFRYTGCLSVKPVEYCAREKAEFEAEVKAADVQSRRMAATPPLVLADPTVGSGRRQPINCVQTGAFTNCW